ncbi:MAG: PQQ-dependent sugar dehydrogenase [Actinomycetota bacterium]|nr:PQQ-dependent sugar dehydrogenase [Actinomycetota bacterium]
MISLLIRLAGGIAFAGAGWWLLRRELRWSAQVRRLVGSALVVLGAIELGWTGVDAVDLLRSPASERREVDTTVLVADAAGVAALAPLVGGGLRYGERTTGVIREVAADGSVRTVAEVAVSTGGQRGLLGVAVDVTDRTFAAWTDPTGRIVVGQVAPGSTRQLWVGPPSADLANGGHLAVLGDGRLVIGIGDLQQPESIDDPGVVNGKVITLDPDGAVDQQPETLSDGWHNPFAFALIADEVWLADNAPGRQPERLARADSSPLASNVVSLPPRTAPSGIAAIGSDLYVCSYLERVLLRYRVVGAGAVPAGRIEVDCRLGVAALGDGRLVVSTGRDLRTFRPVR